MGIGFAEVVMIVMIIVLIFGASRLPALGRGVGAGIRNFKGRPARGSRQGQALVSRVGNPPTFSARGLPSGFVTPSSNIPLFSVGTPCQPGAARGTFVTGFPTRD